jgi:hypothetical protein
MAFELHRGKDSSRISGCLSKITVGDEASRQALQFHKKKLRATDPESPVTSTFLE